MTGLVSFVRELGKELDLLVERWDTEVAQGAAPNPFRLLRDAVVTAAKRTFLA